jgi:DNA-binding transcriptional LysR family regulator
MALNLHLLRLFASVAAHGSFSRAADALHISQPAISRGVRELEAQTGARLLERLPRGAVPTEAGRTLLRHATILFAAEREAEEDLAARRGLARGSLAIGASTTCGTWYLPPLLAAFHAAHPAIALHLRNANTAGIAEALLARDLDVALVEGPVDQPGVLVRPWRQDRMILIAAASHKLARREGDLEAEAMGDSIMVVREPGSGTRDVALAALAAAGIAPRALLEVGSTEMIRQVVSAGLGVALVSAVAVRDQIAAGTLRALQVRGLSVVRSLSRLSLPDRMPHAAAAAFDHLLDGAPPAPETCLAT